MRECRREAGVGIQRSGVAAEVPGTQPDTKASAAAVSGVEWPEGTGGRVAAGGRSDWVICRYALVICFYLSPKNGD